MIARDEGKSMPRQSAKQVPCGSSVCSSIMQHLQIDQIWHSASRKRYPYRRRVGWYCADVEGGQPPLYKECGHYSSCRCPKTLLLLFRLVQRSQNSLAAVPHTATRSRARANGAKRGWLYSYCTNCRARDASVPSDRSLSSHLTFDHGTDAPALTISCSRFGRTR